MEPNFTNNSDDEDRDDFTSFPTIPDPEEKHAQSLGRLISTTLRKVTNNALATYTRAQDEVPNPAMTSSNYVNSADTQSIQLDNTDIASSNQPTIASTSKQGLRLSNLSIPKLQPPTTTTIVTTAPPQVTKANSTVSTTPSIAKANVLQSKITSIFNNLPNDIELSDDSGASDTETINNSSSTTNTSLQMRYSKSRTKSTKFSPKKRALPNVILDNAKQILNQSVSSASSVMMEKRKKKPKKPSNNPLKSGGIPKFYWMNDSFVSDCLNCFKPFTAFRRKHHCRFCGQIFCSDCTLFISYQQHKDERKIGRSSLNDNETTPKSYSDKLRVCKPCYSDVIVYLSDESSSSSEEEGDEINKSSNHNYTLYRVISDSSTRESISRVISHSSLKEDSPKRLPKTPEIKTVPYQRNHSLHMTIPTTRKGESVEIPAVDEYNELPRVINNSVINRTPNWLKNYSYLQEDIAKSHSMDSKFPTRRRSSLGSINVTPVKPTSPPKSHNVVENSSMTTQDREVSSGQDPESENEDEQVMSLYTLLNPYNNTYSLGTSQQPVVPTLGEFPRMMAGSDGNRFSRNVFGSTPPDTLLSKVNEKSAISFLEDKSKSYTRSNERAHASLLRMRSRRKSKSARNVLTKNNNNNNNQNNLNIINTQFDDSFGYSSPSTPLSPTPKKIISVSPSPFEENEKTTEIVYKNYLECLLNQILTDCNVGNQDVWKLTINQLLTNVDKLKLTDTLDIKQYIKIKKILGGKISDSVPIDGMFMTKNIDSKKMLSRIENPKIALLMFPLEYLKQKEQFISLRIIHSQQSVYITNLVSRLVSLEPDIVVLGDTVSGLAEKLLEDAGITVISNTKPQVIERISRYTGAEIFQSVNDLFFKKGTLGTCGLFEVRRYRYQNLVKTFIFFTGGNIEKGFTIALRGGNAEELDNVKYALEIMMFARYNSNFERSFFDDQGIIYKNDWNENPIEEIDFNGVREEFASDEDEMAMTIRNTTIDQYINQFNERIVSVSPCVRFSLPPVLYNVRVAYKEFLEFYKKYKQIQGANTLDEIGDFTLNINQDKLPNKESDVLKILKYTSKVKLEALYSDLQARSRLWAISQKNTSYQLHPIFHKSIHVLSSTVSIKHQTPCFGPSIVVIDYYTDNDKCFGLFVDQIFAESTKTCDECRDLLLDHYRSYSHGNGKVDMVLERVEHPSYHNKRVMWSYCKECHSASGVSEMSDETYFLSIGKFFELTFWGQGVVHRGECGHDYFKSRVRYVGYNNLAIRMVYSPIDTYEVVVPRKQLSYMPEIDTQLKIEAINTVQTKTQVLFNSVNARLMRVKIDTIDKNEEGHARVEEMKTKLKDQMADFYTRTMHIYNSTSPTSYLPLNQILRNLQETSVAWENEFQEFAKNYLPSENEITKITQFHLKKFLEKESESEISIALKNTENEENSQNVENYKNEKGETMESNISERSNSCTTNDQDPQNCLGSSAFDNVNIAADDEPKTPQKEKIIPEIIQNLELHRSHSPKSKIINDINEPNGEIPTETLDYYNTSPKTPSDKIFKANGSPTPVAKDAAVVADAAARAAAAARKLSTVNSPQSMVLEKIHRMEAMIADFENDPKISRQGNYSKSPLNKYSGLARKESEGSINSRDTQSSILGVNKVQHLASFFDQLHFDQISAEFKKQREREMKKKLNRYRAYPVVDSKPIVEIYDKIEDAVDVDEKRDIHVPAQKPQVEINDTEEKKEDKPKEGDIPQPEKNSLLKSLTMFWADRSATLWDPLEYPLGSSEHAFADSEVIVREDEPSSLIALCLSSNDYKQKIKYMANEKDNDSGYDFEINNKKAQNFFKIEKKFKEAGSEGSNDMEVRMNKKSTTHLKYQYFDGQAILSCKIFYSEQFEAFREACGNSESFVQSLSRCIKWDSSGGKSGSSFLKTLDNRYILKELSKSELESFVAIAPFYFKYMSQVMFHTLSTAIAKIFGFYQIHVKNPITGNNTRMDFLIMENLFYNKKTTRIFDLKGSMRNRHVQQTGKENEVLLDENMVEYIYESPVFVREQSKKLLRGSLFNDTAFLSAMDVMDYSLVIGIVEDGDKKKLCVGIIDCIRTFTWDKKVENWVKGTNLIGKKGKDPTIITPKQYRIRFREAMERYILEVPDCWYEGK